MFGPIFYKFSPYGLVLKQDKSLGWSLRFIHNETKHCRNYEFCKPLPVSGHGFYNETSEGASIEDILYGCFPKGVHTLRECHRRPGVYCFIDATRWPKLLLLPWQNSRNVHLLQCSFRMEQYYWATCTLKNIHTLKNLLKHLILTSRRQRQKAQRAVAISHGHCMTAGYCKLIKSNI